MRLYGTEGGFARREGAPVWRGEVCLFAPAELEAVHLLIQYAKFRHQLVV